MTQHETVGFSDRNQQWIYGVETALDAAHHALDDDGATLDKFFARPIKISSVNWPINGQFGVTLNPWELYFNNPRVINRIANYKNMRASLCVRIMINGNGFHYGRALASYRPLFREDALPSWRLTGTRYEQDVIGASQRMHVWLDPTKSQGGTLNLPYVFYSNMLDIPDGDYEFMGELDIGSVTPLKHANDGEDSVTISVFAWAEDVLLTNPTRREPAALIPQMSDYVTQMGEMESMSTGPVSGPAAAIAKAAGMLKGVPRIGSLATATQMASSGIAGIAKYFGMLRPVSIAPPQTFVPMVTGNITNTNEIDTSRKLTFDSKQELTIDPVATGLGSGDEMAISSIATRESYITQFGWRTDDPPEALLWNSYVTPMLFDTVFDVFLNREVHMTPMAWVGRAFENWRGSIKFRFQVVASSFHKGRIKVVYDPSPYPGVVLDPNNVEYNTQQTHVIDIAESRDFEIQIDWGQKTSFLNTETGLVTTPFSSNLISTSKPLTANGCLGVYVVNDLTQPGAGLDVSDVSILVSVAACDNFEVVNPNDNELDSMTFFPEPPPAANRLVEQMADNENPETDNTAVESRPIDVTATTNFGCGADVDMVYKLYYGDPVTSLRQIFKRYVLSRAIGGLGDRSEMNIITSPDFPAYRGYDPAGCANTFDSTDTPYNYVSNTPLNWFTPLFLCRRGGIRHKYAVLRSDLTLPISLRRFAFKDRGYAAPAVAPIYSSASFSSNTVLGLGNGPVVGFSGGDYLISGIKPVMEVELPFFSSRRFYPARKLDLRAPGSEFSAQHEFRYSGLSNQPVPAMQYVSVGEDFSLSFFQGCPVCYQILDPSPSVTQ